MRIMTAKSVHIFTTTVAILLTTILIFVFYFGHSIATRHTPLIDAVMDIKLEVTTAHLWFEEMMGGDQTIKINDIWHYLDEVDWYLNAILHGDKKGIESYYAINDPDIRKKIFLAKKELKEFRKIALERYTHQSSSLPGSLLDQKFDEQFQYFIRDIDNIQLYIQHQIELELRYYRWLGIGLILLSIILSFFLSRFLYLREQKKEILLNNLSQANQNIADKNKELNFLAHYDHLTSLPNRVLFYDRLNQAMSHAKQHNAALVLLFLDLDNFKAINDNFGHQKGDELLKQASSRFKACVREDDLVARISGDEFVIILNQFANIDIASKISKDIASRIIETISQPFDLTGVSASVSTSIGISFFPNDSTNRDELIRHADNAMYKAKALGKNNHQFHLDHSHALG